MITLEKFNEHIRLHQLFEKDDRLLLAVSGGLDSVVMLDLCIAAGFRVMLAHCNFQLRGTESDRDEAFVEKLAKHYGVALYKTGFDTLTIAQQQKKSVEETARDLRYAWFQELLASEKNKTPTGRASYLLTAHHADDNIETVTMNFFRGTGIRGVRGIQHKQGDLVRPLLFATRADLEAYAQSKGLEYMTDRTNADTAFTRNFFRHRILPQVAQKYPKVNENIFNNIRRFEETALLYEQAIDLHRKYLLETRGEEVYIPVLKLKKTVPLTSVVYEIVAAYGFTAHQVPDILRLLESETGRYVQSGSHRILKHRNWLVIAPLASLSVTHCLVEPGTNHLEFPGGRLSIQARTAEGMKISSDLQKADLDAADITYPLIIRRWKAGDYFYPLGMKKKKKISRFLTDLKLSLSQKEQVWVLESDKKIIWVMGCRIDDRFKLTASTRTVLHLELT